MHTSINNTDRRVHSDRRRQPTSISRYTFIGGRRKIITRETDKKKHLLVDLYSPPLLIMLLSLLLFNYVDTYLTLILIKQGIVVEANPFMAFYLEYGVLSFVLTKFFITAISLTILCLFKNVYIARIGLPFSIMMYISVIIYEFYIIYKYRAYFH